MAGLADDILTSALGFIEARLSQLAQQALQSSAGFANQLGVDAARAAGATVDGDLNTARTELAGVLPALQAADPRTAANHIAAAVQAIEGALQAVTAGDPAVPTLGAFLMGIANGAPGPSGLVRQLGLLSSVPSPADGIDADAQRVIYKLAIARGRDIVEGPLRLSPGPTTLIGVLRLDGQTPRLALTVRATDSELSVADNIVATLLGGGGSVRAEVMLGVDFDRGLTIGGTTQQRVSLPASVASGGLDVRGLSIAVADPAEAVNAVDIGASLAGSLGGVMALLLDGAGLQLHIEPTLLAGDGEPLSITAKSPDSIGLSVDAGLVRGGGFLSHRRVDGRDDFGGALQLKCGPVDVKAFGILSLGGETDFSLIIVMSIEFEPPIELALLFTLNGVGGIVGIQRGVDTDALAAGLHSHAVDHMLFPPDPVLAAPVIINTLATVFPPRRGAIVIGPMIKLGWGRPISFLTAALGVILTVPDPKLIILGDVRLQVPAPALPIIDLRAEVLGEFSADKTLVRALLEDSRIAFFSVSGEIGFLIRTSGSAEIAFSAGGFHPRFTPPAELTGMRRMTTDFSPPAVLTLRAESYVAITSNSFQLGNRVDLAASVGPVSADGYFEFDAIVHFSPFAFEVDLLAGIHIRFEGASIAGIDLHLHLRGPRPWRAEGTATFSILWFDKDVHVGPLSWGPEDQPPQATVQPRQLVRDELSKAGAWQALLPPGADRLVDLLPPPVDDRIYVHPLGMFEVRQRLAPLEVVIAKMGGSRVDPSETRLHLGQPQINSKDVQALSEVTDLFAPGEFLDLTDDQKLSRPAFEPMQAGIRINPPAGAQFDTVRALQSDLKYETFVPHKDQAPIDRMLRVREAPHWLLTAPHLTVAAGAAGRSDLRAADRYKLQADPIALIDASVVEVRRTDNLSVQSAPMIYSQAAELAANLADQQLVRLGVAS